MPTWFLRERQAQLREFMDDPNCNLGKLEATYRNFHVVNQFISGWRQAYLRWLRPELRGGATTLLDIGCGGGDLLQKLALWASEDGLEVQFTGLDADARAIRYARKRPFPPNVRFCRARSEGLLEGGARFDLVVSNHLLHHLSDEELRTLCRDCEHLARRLVVHNDIRRSDLAHLGFALTRPLFQGSFITPDGLTSIRRSFTQAELREVAPAGWRVETLFPYRNLLIYHPKGENLSPQRPRAAEAPEASLEREAAPAP